MTKRADRFAFQLVALLLVAITPALCPARAFAQGKSGAAQAAPATAGAVSSIPGQANEQSALDLITFVLKLNDSQREQVHAAFDAALKEAAPIGPQMEAGKNALFAAARSGKSEEEIKHIAEQQGAFTSRVLLLQAQTFAKLWALLDSQQKSRVDDFIYSNIRLFLPALPQ